MSNEASDTSFDRLIRRYRRDAVLLHHPYPPHTAPRMNSKFGGLPTLPANQDWPRATGGTPFHFFAQIDCFEIPFRTALPDRGMLFFFGRDDTEQNWRRGQPADNYRVLYTLDPLGPPREVPDDLGPIGGDYAGAAIRKYLREDEQGVNVHVEWPIQPLRIDTWPDALHAMPGEPNPMLTSLKEYGLHLLGRAPKRPKWQEEQERGRRYKKRIHEFRAEAFARATGERWDYGERSSVQDVEAGLAIFEHAASGPEAYPQYWITIHYAVRAMLHSPVLFGSDSLAEEWLRRSNEAGLDEPVSEEDRGAFRFWLTCLDRSWDTRSPLSHRGRTVVYLSMVATIRAWAGDPQRAARIAPHIYAAMRFHFSGASVWGWQYAQMLGHAASEQSPPQVDDPIVCLLNLASDPALGWMFHSVGYCTFWIEPGDLARRDFSKVIALMQGS